MPKFTTRLPGYDEVHVTYTYWPGSAGAHDRCGVPLEPDTDPEIEINSVICSWADITMNLTDDESATIQQECWGHFMKNQQAQLREEPPEKEEEI